jgi:hypothetical protein
MPRSIFISIASAPEVDVEVWPAEVVVDETLETDDSEDVWVDDVWEVTGPGAVLLLVVALTAVVVDWPAHDGQHPGIHNIIV